MEAPFAPNFFLNNITPSDWAMNCTTIRMAKIAVMTSDNFNNKLKIKPDPQRTSNEI